MQTADVGFRYGTAIRSYRKRYIATEGGNTVAKNQSGNGIRKRPVAHMRKAHWHLYWTGEGRKTPVTRWVAPFMAGGHGDAVDVTIHRVKR